MVIKDYQVGNANDLLSIILHNHLSITDRNYLTNILENNGDIKDTVNTIEANQAKIKEAINTFESLLEQSVFDALHISYTTKLYNLLNNIDVPHAWIDFYSRNRLTVNTYYPKLKEMLDKYISLKAEIIPYVIKNYEITYTKIKNLSTSIP